MSSGVTHSPIKIATEASGLGGEQSSPMGYVYTIVELCGVLRIKATPIAKETDKALFLGDSILVPHSNQTKRLLIKGHDRIARTEPEAIQQYLQYLSERLIDLDKARMETEKLIATAANLL